MGESRVSQAGGGGPEVMCQTVPGSPLTLGYMSALAEEVSF